MKKRLIFAAMLLLAFGSVKAQDTLTSAPQKADTVNFVSSDLSDLPKLMHELGFTLEQLSDSVDWEQFERDMEKWAEEMEKWGRKMEKWGERWEEKYGRNYDYPCYRPEPRKDEPKKPESKGKRPAKKNLLFDANWSG